MVVVFCILVTALLFLVAAATARHTESVAFGAVVALCCLFLFLSGLKVIQSDARADGRIMMAANVCYSTVTAEAEWHNKSISGLRAAAAAAVPAAYLAEGEASRAEHICHLRLVHNAGKA